MSPSANSITDATYPQLLEMQAKFLAWYPSTNHPDKDLKKHIYENHILPRIRRYEQDRDLLSNIQDTLLEV